MKISVLDLFCEKKIIGRGGFSAHVTEDLQLAFEAELCGSLGALEVIKIMRKNLEVNTKMKFNFASDCKSTLYKFDTTHRVVTMSEKLHRVVRGILIIKKENFKDFQTTKVDAHQDRLKD